MGMRIVWIFEGNFHRPVFERRTIKAREEGKIIRRFPEIRRNSWYSALILRERRTLASFVLFVEFPEHLQSSIRRRSENEFSLRPRVRMRALTLLISLRNKFSIRRTKRLLGDDVKRVLLCSPRLGLARTKLQRSSKSGRGVS